MFHIVVSWESHGTGGDVPQLKGARFFTLEELHKSTNNFSEANNIGSGGYGKVDFINLKTYILVTSYFVTPMHLSGSCQGGVWERSDVCIHTLVSDT